MSSEAAPSSAAEPSPPPSLSIEAVQTIDDVTIEVPDESEGPRHTRQPSILRRKSSFTQTGAPIDRARKSIRFADAVGGELHQVVECSRLQYSPQSYTHHWTDKPYRPPGGNKRAACCVPSSRTGSVTQACCTVS